MTSKTDSLPKGRLDCDEDFLRGYHVGYRRGSFHDGEKLGFEHGYLERKIQAAIRCRDEIQDMIMERTEDNDSEDDETPLTQRLTAAACAMAAAQPQPDARDVSLLELIIAGQKSERPEGSTSLEAASEGRPAKRGKASAASEAIAPTAAPPMISIS